MSDIRAGSGGDVGFDDAVLNWISRQPRLQILAVLSVGAWGLLGGVVWTAFQFVF